MLNLVFFQVPQIRGRGVDSRLGRAELPRFVSEGAEIVSVCFLNYHKSGVIVDYCMLRIY